MIRMEACSFTRRTANVVVPVVILDAEEDAMLLDAFTVVVMVLVLDVRRPIRRMTTRTMRMLRRNRN
jgi:hypothetical protein